VPVAPAFCAARSNKNDTHEFRPGIFGKDRFQRLPCALPLSGVRRGIGDDCPEASPELAECAFRRDEFFRSFLRGDHEKADCQVRP
jgi:hypothetical protein